jgi:hypothetical protein
MLAAADHALLELGAILCNDLFHAQFLKLDGGCKVLHDNFVTAEISHCFFQQVVLSAYLHHIVNKCCLGFLDPSLDAFGKRTFRHVRQNQKVLSYVFLFEEFIANCCCLLRVDNQELEALFEGDFDCDVVLAINRLDKLVELAKVTLASALKLLQDSREAGIVGFYIFLRLKLAQFKLLFK